MRSKTKWLLCGFFLGALAIAVTACNLSSPPPTPDYNATMTAFRLDFTRIANTPTLDLPSFPTDTPTPTSTSDFFSLTHIPEVQPTFLTPGTPAILPTTGPRPLNYTLQSGEHPWCIARRFDVDPRELLSLNNLSAGRVYPTGLVLSIPQSGRQFPGTRALHPHPVAYVVSAAQMTVYKVACHFGDVDPAAIMQHNQLTSPILTFGQVLQIP